MRQEIEEQPAVIGRTLETLLPVVPVLRRVAGDDAFAAACSARLPGTRRATRCARMCSARR
jgi:hypothetical protein